MVGSLPHYSHRGRPPRDLVDPSWTKIASELKRKGVTLTLLSSRSIASGTPMAMDTLGFARR